MFDKPSKYSQEQWKISKYCSNKCHARDTWQNPTKERLLISIRNFQKATERNTGKFGRLANGWKDGKQHGGRKHILFNIDLLPKNLQEQYNFMFIRSHNRYCYEHRIKAALELNRPLTSIEVIHHIDGNPKNNEHDNLYLFSSNTEHLTYENQKNKILLNSNLL